MEVKTGYIYHIKDEFFDVVKDEKLMTNHERGKKRPTYFTIKDKNILWFIPLSSKVEKYKRIIESKLKKYHRCDTILIREIMGIEHAVLLQNAFPTLEKYIDHIHTIDGIPAQASENTKDEILIKFRSLLRMKNKGVNLFFTDIDRIRNQMLEEMTVKS